VEEFEAFLTSLDRGGRLPTLGGMARPNGVVIASARYWAFSATDGTLHEGVMPELPQTLRRVPILRGLARLAVAFAPLARGAKASGGDRWLVAAAVAVPAIPSLVVPAGFQLAVGAALTCVLAILLLRGRTLFLHGAEHRAIAASERRALADTWRGNERPPRFSRRCGTNFAALALAFTLVIYAFIPAARDTVWSLPIGVATLGATMELWALIQSGAGRTATFLLAPGLALQRLTTREPSLDETRMALRAVASVLLRELS
jgi:uncharacterized protein YqhQ